MVLRAQSGIPAAMRPKCDLTLALDACVSPAVVVLCVEGSADAALKQRGHLLFFIADQRPEERDERLWKDEEPEDEGEGNQLLQPSRKYRLDQPQPIH
jgi:hypothetical protein